MRVNFKAAIKTFKAYNKTISLQTFKTYEEMRTYICKLATTNVGAARHDNELF